MSYAARKQLSAPKVCDNCQSERIGLTSNAVVYGVEQGPWPYCYYCDDCASMVSCHPNTYNPMGLMATGAVRRKRGRLHEVFDPIYLRGFLTREDAYKWLANVLNLDPDIDCHISQLSREQLTTATDILSAHIKNDYAMFKRRKEKSDAKRFDRNRRQDAKISQRKSKYQSK